MAANARQTYDAVTTLTKTLEGLLPKLVAPAAPAPAAAPVAKSDPPAQPADAGYATLSAQVTALQRDIAVKSAIADHGFTGELRTTFEDLVGGASADQVKSIAEKLSKLKPAAAAPASAAAAPTVKPGTSNAGPAAPGAAPIIPDRLRDIPPEVLRGMSMQEIRDKYEAQKRAQGQGNPWAAAREQLSKK